MFFAHCFWQAHVMHGDWGTFFVMWMVMCQLKCFSHIVSGRHMLSCHLSTCTYCNFFQPHPSIDLRIFLDEWDSQRLRSVCLITLGYSYFDRSMRLTVSRRVCNKK